jgi:hypothetical protein
MRESLESRCRRNVECWLRENGFPPVETFRHQPDRCLIRCDGPFAQRCDEIMDRWDGNLSEIDAHRPFGYISATRGWAERGRIRYGAQIIEHWGPTERVFEMDFDYWRSNNGWGMGAIGHGIEWLWNRATHRKTDPFRIAKARGWLAA